VLANVAFRWAPLGLAGARLAVGRRLASRRRVSCSVLAGVGCTFFAGGRSAAAHVGLVPRLTFLARAAVASPSALVVTTLAGLAVTAWAWALCFARAWRGAAATAALR
jgi:hypothetical protein